MHVNTSYFFSIADLHICTYLHGIYMHAYIVYINIKFVKSLIFMHRYKRKKREVEEEKTNYKQTHMLAATTARNRNIYTHILTYVYKKERL